MNFGDCPYCDSFIGFFEVPDKCPVYAIVKCESCGKDIWYRFSRINPQSWTIEDFEKEFIVDSENKKIIERNPKNETKIPKELLDRFVAEYEKFILYGDSKIEKPVGILNAKELIDNKK